MGVLAGKPSTRMSVLVNTFQSEESNCMVAEAMEEYVLASAEAGCEDPGEQASMEFMAAGVGSHYGTFSHSWY